MVIRVRQLLLWLSKGVKTKVHPGRCFGNLTGSDTLNNCRRRCPSYWDVGDDLLSPWCLFIPLTTTETSSSPSFESETSSTVLISSRWPSVPWTVFFFRGHWNIYSPRSSVPLLRTTSFLPRHRGYRWSISTKKGFWELTIQQKYLWNVWPCNESNRGT